jgi:GT2 family glycosyltransferase
VNQPVIAETAGSQPVRVSVSMVTFNSSFDLLARTIDGLSRALCHAREQGMAVHLQLLVVDNTSHPGKKAGVRELVLAEAGDKFDALEFWHSGWNIGYGAAHNQALARADSDYHLVMNPDVELAEDALLVGTRYLNENSDVAMISPLATNASGQNQYLCKHYPSVLVFALRAFAPSFLQNWFRDYLYSYELRDRCGDQAVVDVPLVSGCCMYARTSTLRQVTGFSGHFFMYFEDFDLSLRLHSLGRLVYLPQMHIVHHGGYSARKGWRHITMFARSGWKFFSRHGWCWV